MSNTKLFELLADPKTAKQADQHAADLDKAFLKEWPPELRYLLDFKIGTCG